MVGVLLKLIPYQIIKLQKAEKKLCQAPKSKPFCLQNSCFGMGFQMGFLTNKFPQETKTKWEEFLAPTGLTQVGDLLRWGKVFCIILSSLS
jgi:hypothetical protein